MHMALTHPLGQMAALAAEGGQTAILEFALAEGLPLTELTVLGAIKGHSLPCLKIACEADAKLVPACAGVFAALHGFEPGLRYLNLRDFPLWAKDQPINAEGLHAMRKRMQSYFLDPSRGGRVLDMPRDQDDDGNYWPSVAYGSGAIPRKFWTWRTVAEMSRRGSRKPYGDHHVWRLGTGDGWSQPGQVWALSHKFTLSCTLCFYCYDNY
jgi:hypothetical protein